jgi:hypothetical protein
VNTHFTWACLEPDAQTILAAQEQPLQALAEARVPALILRNALPVEHCQSLISHMVSQGLLPDPELALPQALQDQAIPEGYYREGRNQANQYAWNAAAQSGKARIDIGTSLGYRGSDPEAFFAHSRETHALFRRLFGHDHDGYEGRGPHNVQVSAPSAKGVCDPVQTLYDALQSVAGGRRVLTAREADGQLYGPAIVRAHYGGYTYAPHFDSVRLRENREGYAVHGFSHQFAGVLILQNACLGDSTAQCTIHKCLWEPHLDPHLKAGTFHDYAKSQAVPKTTVHLNPGDLYFFNTRCIHEVPGLTGATPRIVVATFIGFDEGRDEIFVWS